MAMHIRPMPTRSGALVERVNGNARLTKAVKVGGSAGSEQEQRRLKLQPKFFASIGETLPYELEVQLETVRTCLEAVGRCGDEPWNLVSRGA
jgi:hypothetical protein